MRCLYTHKNKNRDAWLAQLIEHTVLILWVMSLSLILGVEIILKNKKATQNDYVSTKLKYNLLNGRRFC